VSTNEEAAADALIERVRKRLFNRFDLLRSTPFRIGMLFWLLFTACFGIASFVVYETLQTRALDRIDRSITERFARLQDDFTIDGIEAVVEVVEARSSSPMTSRMGYHLSTLEGQRIAGNVPICPTAAGWHILLGEDLGLDSDESVYRFFTGRVGNNVLSLGKSLDDLVELREIALSSLIWTTLASTILAFLAASWFARRTHRRVSGISHALDGVAQGNLHARLPVTCADDDIDRLSIKINNSLNRLEHTVNGMRQVSTDIAHDLKTPLNHLYITIEEAATRSRSGVCVGDELEGALDEAKAINGTFEALLRIAQIEAGARRSQFKHFDLTGVLQTAAEVYAPVVDENRQQMVVDLPKNQSLPMFGDKRLVLQLIVNLIENAVRHCIDNTIITLSAGEEDDLVWFKVADSGPGIPDDERDKVFQRLYRLERSRTTKGTGLGLSLVKAIAELHCGSVELENNHPGLAVTVRFDRDCTTDQ
jgi:signal transduction histidine kinase